MWGNLLGGLGSCPALCCSAWRFPPRRLRSVERPGVFSSAPAFIICFVYHEPGVGLRIPVLRKAADAFALSLTRDGESFIRGQVYCQEQPVRRGPTALHTLVCLTHPTTLERIRSAK